jgi:hypothetical protein
VEGKYLLLLIIEKIGLVFCIKQASQFQNNHYSKEVTRDLAKLVHGAVVPSPCSLTKAHANCPTTGSACKSFCIQTITLFYYPL